MNILNKYKLFAWMTCLFVAVMFFSCDIISEDERVKKVENITTVRPVLLEDFTGQACINCPAATATAHELKKALGDNLIIVSIHAGVFAQRAFRTEVGDEYHNHFYGDGSDGYPAGMIDRTMVDNDRISTNFLTWGGFILGRAQLESVPKFELGLAANYDENNRSLTVNAKGRSFEELTNIKIQLWLTESKIIAFQRSGTEMIPDYEHNHILRDAINGTWGENLELKSANDYHFDYTCDAYTISENWKPENMHIVGFLYDAKTEEVLHTVEIPLIEQ